MIQSWEENPTRKLPLTMALLDLRENVPLFPVSKLLHHHGNGESIFRQAIPVSGRFVLFGICHSLKDQRRLQWIPIQFRKGTRQGWTVCLWVQGTHPANGTHSRRICHHHHSVYGNERSMGRCHGRHYYTLQRR